MAKQYIAEFKMEAVRRIGRTKESVHEAAGVMVGSVSHAILAADAEGKRRKGSI